MVSMPRFFNKPQPIFDEVDASIHVVDSPVEPLPQWAEQPIVTPPADVDPVRKAVLARIALVSVEDNHTLPALLPDTSNSPLVQRMMLPRNPRIAADELYELDGMDMIVIISEEEKRIGKDTLRWLKLLKSLKIPMVVLLPYVTKKRHEQAKVEQFVQYFDVPVVMVTADNLDAARQEFVMTTQQIAPAISLALAAQMEPFRPPLMHHLLDTATTASLLSVEDDEIAATQMQLVRQICAAHGCNGHQYEQHQAALETLVNITTHYTEKLVGRFPIRDDERRSRLTKALGTLFIGHATATYLGAIPPSFRKDLLPQIWRLYRASGKAILE